ncbi:MAG: sugar ABC transporter permease [Chloroflexota bacterium]
MSTMVRRRLGWGLFFIFPWIIGFVAFTVYPIGASLYYSFTNYNIINFTPNWVGLDNYTDLFFDDHVFWKSLRVTLYYVVMLVVLATIFDIIIAMLLNMNVIGLSLYRTIFYLPVMVPVVAATLTWVWILNPRHGLINGMLDRIGIDGPLWLASPRTALLSLVLVAVWGSGRAVLIYLAGLKDIPQHLYEAAEIDGATAWHKIRHVTLPLLTPQMLFNVVTMTIFSMQSIAAPLIMTGGGPNKSTLMYGLHLYQLAFERLRMGYASAMAWILFVVILVLTVVMFWGTQRYVHYER